MAPISGYRVLGGERDSSGASRIHSPYRQRPPGCDEGRWAILISRAFFGKEVGGLNLWAKYEGNQVDELLRKHAAAHKRAAHCAGVRFQMVKRLF